MSTASLFIVCRWLWFWVCQCALRLTEWSIIDNQHVTAPLKMSLGNCMIVYTWYSTDLPVYFSEESLKWFCDILSCFSTHLIEVCYVMVICELGEKHYFHLIGQCWEPKSCGFNRHYTFWNGIGSPVSAVTHSAFAGSNLKTSIRST